LRAPQRADVPNHGRAKRRLTSLQQHVYPPGRPGQPELPLLHLGMTKRLLPIIKSRAPTAREWSMGEDLASRGFASPQWPISLNSSAGG
jgi:hypothetical protein